MQADQTYINALKRLDGDKILQEPVVYPYIWITFLYILFSMLVVRYDAIVLGDHTFYLSLQIVLTLLFISLFQILTRHGKSSEKCS